MRAVKFAGAALAAVIIVLALVLAVGIPSGFLNSAIASRVETATGYRLTITGSSRISLWPRLNVTLNDLTVEDPKDRTGISRLTVEKVQAHASLSSLWSGHPRVTELVITRPVLYSPLLRERLPNPAAAAKPAAPLDAGGATIDRIKVADGELAFSRVRGRVENRIGAINIDATIGSDRKVDMTGTARAGDHAVKLDLKATAPAAPLERQSVPVDFAIEVPDLLQSQLTGRAEMRLNGSVVMINGLSGQVGDGAFNGWASVDMASKPLVKVDLDFQRLEMPFSKAPAGSAAQPWSDASIDISGLNYVDAQLRLSASEADIGETRFAPVAVDARLAGGVLKANVTKLGAYEGQLGGEVILDATSGSPSFAMHSDIAGVQALPLLKGLAGFERLDGRLQAKLALRSAGASQHALMSNMQGTVFANFENGAIRGINVAQMIRSLASGMLSGWQEGETLSTDLTQLSASFRVDKGQAVTTDLNLVGPLARVTGVGTIDIGTKLMAFRVEPKLVLTSEGQGRSGDPVAFGLPVMIDGSWSQPRIYPDMAGILDNPDAAYAKLREMGKGLFGPDGAGLGTILNSFGLGGSATSSANPGSGTASPQQAQPGQPQQNGLLGGPLGEAIGNLIQQGLSSGPTSRSRSMPATPAAPAPQAQPSSPGRDDAPVAQQDSEPMNQILRQLFNR